MSQVKDRLSYVFVGNKKSLELDTRYQFRRFYLENLKVALTTDEAKITIILNFMEEEIKRSSLKMWSKLIKLYHIFDSNN